MSPRGVRACSRMYNLLALIAPAATSDAIRETRYGEARDTGTQLVFRFYPVIHALDNRRNHDALAPGERSGFAGRAQSRRADRRVVRRA
jgi:hypothetical protein